MRNRNIILFALFAVLSVGGYLLFSWQFYDVGFPLDDAWIHQTYARNLAQTGQWMFQEETQSGGSTGPLWGFLLFVFHILSPGAFWGAYFLGIGTLFGTAVVGAEVIEELCQLDDQGRLIAGLLLIFAWHLVWAAGSGMETLPLAMLALWITGQLLKDHLNWFLVGLIVGIGVWLRPDAITLLGPIGFVLFLKHRKNLLEHSKNMTLGLVTSLGPYLLFNLQVAGDFLPNTFYAKQAEYAILRKSSLITRLGRVGLQPLIGVGIVLFPGFVLGMLDHFKKRDWAAIAGPLWVVGFLFLYTWRLPVTYQHGRYIMPVLPVFYIWGMAGMFRWSEFRSARTWRRLLSRSWMGVLIVITAAFWLLGARTYGRDVAVIETEMVQTAHWIQTHTEDSDVIAAHDIGALGYYTERQIVDMAGLVSPEVIPFIRDEIQLKAYLDQSDVDYLVTFPGWYPDLVEGLKPVYRSDGFFAPGLGYENMAVYTWP